MLESDVALMNTAPGASRSGEDELVTTAQLRALLEEHGWSGRFDRDEHELAEVREVRGELRRVWALDRDAMVDAVNAVLDTTELAPHLARHDGKDWHLHASPSDAPLAARLRLETAFALVDVIRADETDRLRECGAEDCDGVLLDLSRNRSKRFCSQRCANRTNMTAYRRRQASDTDTDDRPDSGAGA
ncbi:CGNR zinc finger domain-containing protein [Kocuria sp. UCD-OTCP]|uniref:CGNR zinc finger domain-containing protein n=1 Tax=Kocuria sp. UCD-OTCP TaxID=1292021 RepID=UPI00036BFF59|nr:CGNR zinc finger domain-containing protein [Kocuria sp. UCD-OTCP]